MFGLVFAGFGAVALFGGVKTNERFALYCTAGLFLVVGLGIAARGVWAHDRATKDAARRAANPDTPWRWREDWARGRIATDAPPALFVSWFFVCIFLGFALPLTRVLGRFAHAPDVRLLAVLALLGSACALLAFAIQKTVRHLRMRRCAFVLDGEYGVPGDALRGRLDFNPAVQLRSALDVELRCQRVFSDADRGDDVLWESVTTIDPTNLPAAPLREVPLEIAIPADALASDEFGNPNGSRLTWRLRVRAETDRGTLALEFPVPIYPAPAGRDGGTARAAPRSVNLPAAVSLSTSPSGPIEPTRFAVALRASGLRWIPGASGSPEPNRLVFPAGRRPLLALVPTLAGFGFLGFAAAVFRASGFGWLVAVPALFGSAAWVAAWGNWFDGSTLTIDGDHVRVEKRGLFRVRRTQFARRDIAHVEPRERMSSGDTVWSELLLIGRPVRDCVDAPRDAEPFAARKLRHQIQTATAHEPARAMALQSQLETEPAFRASIGGGVRGAAQARVIADHLTALLRDSGPR